MTASAHERVDLLARVPVLADLPAEDLQQISRIAHPRRFAAGEAVFREGDASNTCYIVRSGRARAVREHPDGRQLALATFGPGDILGELAMFDDERRSATIEAVEPLGCDERGRAARGARDPRCRHAAADGAAAAAGHRPRRVALTTPAGDQR